MTQVYPLISRPLYKNGIQNVYLTLMILQTQPVETQMICSSDISYSVNGTSNHPILQQKIDVTSLGLYIPLHHCHHTGPCFYHLLLSLTWTTTIALSIHSSIWSSHWGRETFARCNVLMLHHFLWKYFNDFPLPLGLGPKSFLWLIKPFLVVITWPSLQSCLSRLPSWLPVLSILLFFCSSKVLLALCPEPGLPFDPLPYTLPTDHPSSLADDIPHLIFVIS